MGRWEGRGVNPFQEKPSILLKFVRFKLFKRVSTVIYFYKKLLAGCLAQQQHI